MLEDLIITEPDDASAFEKTSVTTASPTPEQMVVDVLVILSADDILQSQQVTQQLGHCRIVTFDPSLIDKLRENGIEDIEYISNEDCPGFVDLHDAARTRALKIEDELLQSVQHLLPEVTNLGWNHLDFYYFLLAYRWYNFIADRIVEGFSDLRIHILVNDNAMGFYLPSFIPGIIILERLKSAGIEFHAYSYGQRADETHFIPMLVGENHDPCDVLVHVPTCMHDTQFLEQELQASGKSLFHIYPKYWGIALKADKDIKLVDISNVMEYYPEASNKLIEEFKNVLMPRLDSILSEFIKTDHHRRRQVEHMCNLYRAQFMTYQLLNIYFSSGKPKKILLSDHDAGFHGPIVSFAETHNIPVLLFPHSKTTPDIQFDRQAVTVLTHPIQGQAIFDSKQKRTHNVPLAYPEDFSSNSRAPQPLKAVGLLLNAVSLNGVMVSDFKPYVDGIRKIVDWCQEHHLKLAVRGRPGFSLNFLLERNSGLDVEAMKANTAMPLAAFAASIDVCLMYDAPTTAELEFLRNGVPILNPIVDPLSKYEAVISNTHIIPQSDIQDTLYTLASFLDDPLNLHAFRMGQFSDYVGLFRNAKSLRSLL